MQPSHARRRGSKLTHVVRASPSTALYHGELATSLAHVRAPVSRAARRPGIMTVTCCAARVDHV
eukprot:1953168-Rhodomonas_salina.1